MQRHFFRKIGLKTNQVKNCIIVGGGTISYYLAHALLGMKISVKIIEQNKNRCEHLSELLPDATIINGDGTNRSLLLEEGLSESESFVTLTNLDEENVFLALFAKSISDAKLVAKVNRLEFDDVIDSWISEVSSTRKISLLIISCSMSVPLRTASAAM